MAWGTTASGTYSSVSVNLATGQSQPLTQTRVYISKAKPQSGKAKLINGWRNPTDFRAYTCKMTPGGEFRYKHRSGGTLREHRGVKGYNPGRSDMDIYLGTSGAGRYPRTSENLVNRAEVECMNKLKDSDMNLGESIATINQTLDMIANSLTELLNLIRLAKHRRLVTRKKWDEAARNRRIRNLYLERTGKRPIPHARYMKAKGLPVKRPKPYSLADSWLQYIYGWSPFLNDVQNLIKLINHGVPAVPVKAVRNLTERHALPRGDLFPTSAPYSFSAKGKIESGVKVRIDASVTNPALAQLDALGLINPLSLAWELIPFSFVLDWLVPVGSAIAALSTRVGLDLKAVSVTRYTVAQVHMEWYQYPTEGGNPISCDIDSLTTWRTHKYTWPWAGLYWKSPFTSSPRAATALSLLSKMR